MVHSGREASSRWDGTGHVATGTSRRVVPGIKRPTAPRRSQGRRVPPWGLTWYAKFPYLQAFALESVDRACWDCYSFVDQGDNAACIIDRQPQGPPPSDPEAIL